MVYKKNFVGVVKCEGVVLREEKGVVRLPFGSEYSIYLKNLDSRKAVVSISVDGKDVLDGDRLIVHPNSDIELKGEKIKDNVGNRFKFIQKTKEIAEHRGDRVDDGIIRIEVTFEKREIEKPIEIPYYIPRKRYYDDWGYWKDWYWNEWWQKPYINDIPLNYTYDYKSSMCDSTGNMRNCSVSCNSVVPNNDEGITVKGSEIDQNFVTGYVKVLEEQSEVIIIRLRGMKGDSTEKIKEPITVKTTKICPSCGKKYRSSAKYCSACGTYLE